MANFSLKLSTKRNEIGIAGAGITKNVYSMLLCANLLSTGNAPNQDILPAHLPTEFVLHMSPDALQVLSKRDTNLPNYAHDPTCESITLHRTQDASCLFSRDLAMQSLREGKSNDAVQLLDFAGIPPESTRCLIWSWP